MTSFLLRDECAVLALGLKLTPGQVEERFRNSANKLFHPLACPVTPQDAWACVRSKLLSDIESWREENRQEIEDSVDE
jgi:hypothetical protein